MPQIKGTAVAPGLALGPVHVVRARADRVPLWSVPDAQVDHEIGRLESAVEAATAQLARQQQLVREVSGEQDAGIFAVHQMILKDPGALERVGKQVREERINAEAAVQGLIDHLHSTMGRLEGDSVRSYADDVSEPWRVVLDVLLARDREQVSAGEERVVLAAAELTPQVVTFLGRERILGIVTETGGRFSHGAVLARSFGIPCVVGLPNLLARLEQDLPVLVDGDNGTVTLRPDAAAAADYEERRERRDARRAALENEAALPATTPDGATISIQVNLESIRDLGTFERSHADGVGLLRTEFLYMERNQFPSEEEQYRLYRRVVDHMEGKAVTFRTLDIGGDKELPYFKTPDEANPALGWRGLRVSLEWQDLLRVQLRAILRASAHGSARLLLPMVTSIEEVIAVREVFHGVRAQLIEQGYEVAAELPVGIMIEVPSSLWSLPEIAPLIDFVSVGTNDLTQYLLAVDRDNPLVSKIYDPHHPAVVRALAQVAQVCRDAGRPCAVCGEIAGDYATTLGLLGMGYDSVSVAPNFLAELRYAVRHTSATRARELAGALVTARDSGEVREHLVQMRRELHEPFER